MNQMDQNWAGFTEEDIKNLNSTNETKQDDRRRPIIVPKRRINKNIKEIKEIIEAIPEDAKLNDLQEVENETSTLHVVSDALPVVSEQMNGTKDDRNERKAITLNTSTIEKKVIDLNEFQERQKRMEEQNRRRKELLAKALADRAKQTEEEARKLKEIQAEFKKLDALLSSDVCILRHQIEIASFDFMEAQKKYHKIEKEFLEAKLNLHQKSEKKEMLTEHLCAIIEKNEERKAEKLIELINRLSISEKIIDQIDDVNKYASKRKFANENGVECTLKESQQ